MDCDRIKFLLKKTEAGHVVVEERYAGMRLASRKELGMVHARKEEALKALDSLFCLVRQTSPGIQVEREV